jgi:hypothetical protein
MARLAVNWMTAAKAAIDAKRVFLSMSGFHLYKSSKILSARDSVGQG